MTDFREFLNHGQLPEAGPLQPPEGRPRLALVPPRELTQAEKLDCIRDMAKQAFWRSTVMEAIQESDSYAFFLNALIWKSDHEACEWARSTIVEYVESVMKTRGETWRDYL